MRSGEVWKRCDGFIRPRPGRSLNSKVASLHPAFLAIAVYPLPFMAIVLCLKHLHNVPIAHAQNIQVVYLLAVSVSRGAHHDAKCRRNTHAHLFFKRALICPSEGKYAQDGMDIVGSNVTLLGESQDIIMDVDREFDCVVVLHGGWRVKQVGWRDKKARADL